MNTTTQPNEKAERVVLPVSLRDYFAAKALPAIASIYVEANGRCIGTDHFPRNVATHAYKLADAMLKAREL